MHNIGSYHLWALTVCLLWHGSLAKDSLSGYVCIIEDPGHNQCDNQVLKGQDQGNAKLEGQLQEVQTKMKDSQAELEKKLLSVETKLEGQQAALKNIENQLQALLNKMETSQQATEVPIPSGFDLIGTRYFRVLNEYRTWVEAEKRCRELGGYLAAFQNEKEFTRVQAKLPFGNYWLGIQYNHIGGHFISVASQKTLKFLKFSEEYPNEEDLLQNCVILNNGEMFLIDCSLEWNFICQADNET